MGKVSAVFGKPDFFKVTVVYGPVLATPQQMLFANTAEQLSPPPRLHPWQLPLRTAVCGLPRTAHSPSHPSRLLLEVVIRIQRSTASPVHALLFVRTSALPPCAIYLKGHTDVVTRVVALPDGDLPVAACLDKFVRGSSAANGECLRTLAGHSVFDGAWPRSSGML
jgi:hypothetical protein